MSNYVYNEGKLRMWAGAAGEVDLLTADAIVIALEVDGADDLDDEFVSEMLAGGSTEVSSTGYTGGYGGAGRISLASKTILVDLANDRAEFDCANVVWSAISQAAAEVWAALVIAVDITSDALSPLIAHIDTATGLPLTPNGSDITLTIDAEGLLHVT